MARSVTYSVVPRINPTEKSAPPRYYAQAQARGDVSIREMAERIQATCTVHKSDVYAVLVALEDLIAEAIQNGEIVRLGELCTLQVSLSDKGAMTEDTRTPEQKETLQRLLERLKEDYPDARVVGHRDLPGVKKDCPCFDVNGASFME